MSANSSDDFLPFLLYLSFFYGEREWRGMDGVGGGEERLPDIQFQNFQNQMHATEKYVLEKEDKFSIFSLMKLRKEL